MADTMEYDHRAIESMTEVLAATPIRWTEQLQEDLYGVSALIEVHLEKDERIYLELVEEADAEGPVLVGDPSYREHLRSRRAADFPAPSRTRARGSAGGTHRRPNSKTEQSRGSCRWNRT